MQTLILITCLVAAVFSSPIRKARDISSSRENYYRYYRQLYPSIYNRYFPYRPGFPVQPYYPYLPVNPSFPGNYPNYFPNYNIPNYGRIPMYHGFARNSKSQLSKVKTDNVGDSPQEYSVIRNTRPLSMSSEVSFEDSSSLEDNNFRIPFMNEPYDIPDYGIPGNPDYGVPGDLDYGVPGVPDNERPFLPDNERPFAPWVDTNAVDVGYDQQNSQELSIEVSDTEEPASVLPYSDTVQGMGSLGLNGEDDSMIGYSNEDIRQQNTMYEPAGLDVIYDQTLNNEELANQQMSNENLDEDVQTLEDERTVIPTLSSKMLIN
ncbi:uncharacterized protein LOC144680545 isoform X2 [Cetorhinus maximus]